MNYFEYFSEIEERFVARRGSVLLLSTLDWALIETWREAGVPLAAVLRGIDTAFDKYDERRLRGKGRLAKVNGLAWCAQAVMEAASELAEAAVGAHPAAPGSVYREEQQAGGRATGFEQERVTQFLTRNAELLQAAAASGGGVPQAEAGVTALSEAGRAALSEAAHRLQELALQLRGGELAALDELDRRLTVLEERVLAAVIAGLPESTLLQLRALAERELAPLRSRLGAVQARQLREQFEHKKLFEACHLPRLSLFYMPLANEADEAAA